MSWDMSLGDVDRMVLAENRGNEETETEMDLQHLF